jgi:hypothetical protein
LPLPRGVRTASKIIASVMVALRRTPGAFEGAARLTVHYGSLMMTFAPSAAQPDAARDARPTDTDPIPEATGSR